MRPIRIGAEADLTDVALLMADFNLYSIPVVDGQDRVLGVVTVDDVLKPPSPRIGGAANPPPARSAKSPHRMTIATRLHRRVRRRDLRRGGHRPRSSDSPIRVATTEAHRGA
ncbi:hypothetical protein MTIM_36070 [Mycobacterium timonense]|uniref:CBS domain-containing protein n=1 Tax=Mycobacterium timonense TaxID=701043 RepID=A0A7I9ZA33_9MYCO|nr:hypothetical protein MTIM_36070 [Mycobacterium timonense]